MGGEFGSRLQLPCMLMYVVNGMILILAGNPINIYYLREYIDLHVCLDDVPKHIIVKLVI